MKISDFSGEALRERLFGNGLYVAMAPFVVRISSDIPHLASDIHALYADFPVAEESSFVDFHVQVSFEKGIRRWLKPMARFFFDGRPSFIPLPAKHAFPMLEWGLNWCIAAHAHQYLVIHGAVIERNGMAIILPAPPGAGKSTLCATLVNRGWRLLSDELALIDLSDGLVYGMARPVNLKNQSISIVQAHFPNVIMSEPVPDTTKGTVALMKPPSESVRRVGEAARPVFVILPRYQADAEPNMEPHSKAETLMLMADQSFNYNIHGKVGFEALCRLLEACQCYQFTYSRLSDAEACFDALIPPRDVQ